MEQIGELLDVVDVLTFLSAATQQADTRLMDDVALRGMSFILQDMSGRTLRIYDALKAEKDERR